ncbi:succinate dehydrogenase, hydrophobic membrane anchor protein [Gimibacter soli]|uniref:Succinate dehydrogenase hydrophobic membrane anchor subunit n=1 Tax=Gimibacter soli TaxID=3024400 RepID=A0AAE9XN14_9PROT|nr:succinate dehydrogenase, hydrophobic membrane anchor protein [Gimibacter soli]WCL54023.1 succinate dehydrogenase, hydrophobic membrane anchor protein [Gimibacter soli]
MSDFKAPLAKVRGLGSAKEGTHHWWVQRMSGVANIPLTLFVVTSFIGNAGKPYADWVSWLQQPLVAVLMLLFVLNVTWHLRLGLQVMVEDYVHTKMNKIIVMTAITFGTILLAALGAFSILKIAFGG